MSKITTIVNNIISKVNEHTTDVLALETLNSNHINLSGVTAYHLLQGNLAVSNSTTTQGFNTTLYTGNGSTQNVTTGIDMSTQWGNTAEEKFGGLVWVKGRSISSFNLFHDTTRGFSKAISSNSTNADAINNVMLNTVNGFSLANNDGAYNQNATTYASWNFQTTHRVTGTTNHGQAYECHYNPFTGFTMVKYTGSGIAGHEIPHHLGRKLGFATVKNLVTGSSNWLTCSDSTGYGGGMQLNTTGANNPDASNGIYSENTFLGCKTGDWQMNSSGSSYIAYGWANSYFDKSNKLIGNYEIGVYQGTGVSGNKVSTRGKPAWVMIKRIDSTSDWHIFDNQRDDIVSSVNDGVLWANTSGVESTTTNFISLTPNDGFIINDTTANTNASGGQYLYIVAYDTNANGGGSYYPLASDTANVQVNNALIPIAQGIDSNGAKNTILSKNETFSGVTYTQGKNYPYYDALGNRGVSSHRPRYLESELVRTYAGESPDYYNVKENKWYSTNSGSELVINGKFDVNTNGWTGNGTILSVYNGTLKVANGTTQYAYAYQGINTVIGKTYKVFVDCIEGVYNSPYCFISSSINASGSVSVYNNTLGNSYDGTYIGKKAITFVAQTTTSYLYVGLPTTATNQYVYFDNISVFPVDIIPTTEITNGRNYLNHIVYADNDGGVLYVEELPKIEYKDIVKANEFKGKNACNILATINCTTTPPTILESYGKDISIIRTATGEYDLYTENLDTLNAQCFVNFKISNSSLGVSNIINQTSYNKFHIAHVENGVAQNGSIMNISIFGGKN